jgi:lipid-binding SYLF domain-containing protein
MNFRCMCVLFVLAAGLGAMPAWSEDDAAYSQTLKNFRDQPATVPFFADAVGYTIFPTIGKGGFGIGGAFGTGRAYKRGQHVGNVKMGQVSIGWQFGGQAYSEIIFFQNEKVFQEFTDGDFEFGADASAVALTAGVQASASTKGATASAGTSAENTDKSTANWYRGMAVFTLAKGGLMFQAAIGGQGFDYTPVGAADSE